MNSPLKQIRQFALTLFIIYLPVIALLILVSLQSEVPVAELTRDPASITEMPFYTGLISNIGILMWAITVGICVFSGLLFKNLSDQGENYRFLIFAAALTAILMLDDLLMLHESVFPGMGLPEKGLYAFYGIALLLGGLRFRDTILKSDYMLLVFALACFGLSMGLDQLSSEVPQLIYEVQKSTIGESTAAINPYGWPRFYSAIRFLVEDGGKLMGIMGWMLYFAQFARQNMMTNFIKSEGVEKKNIMVIRYHFSEAEQKNVS